MASSWNLFFSLPITCHYHKPNPVSSETGVSALPEILWNGRNIHYEGFGVRRKERSRDVLRTTGVYHCMVSRPSRPPYCSYFMMACPENVLQRDEEGCVGHRQTTRLLGHTAMHCRVRKSPIEKLPSADTTNRPTDQWTVTLYDLPATTRNVKTIRFQNKIPYSSIDNARVIRTRKVEIRKKYTCSAYIRYEKR